MTLTVPREVASGSLFAFYKLEIHTRTHRIWTSHRSTFAEKSMSYSPIRVEANLSYARGLTYAVAAGHGAAWVVRRPEHFKVLALGVAE